MMKRYDHDFLFFSQLGTVQKTYRLPKYLEEYIATVATRNRLTKTDVVIEALLHYFSPHIIEKISSDIERSVVEIEASQDADNQMAVKRLTFEKRRLEILQAEFYEYFSDSIEKLLERLKESSAPNLPMDLAE